MYRLLYLIEGLFVNLQVSVHMFEQRNLFSEVQPCVFVHLSSDYIDLIWYVMYCALLQIYRL